MVCLSFALPILLGVSVVTATNTDINANNLSNNHLPSLANPPHQGQTPAEVTKSYTPNPLRTDHVLRDAPAVTETQSSTQTSTDAAAATAGLARYVHHHHNCTAMCHGYCRKPDHAKDKIDAERGDLDCPKCDCGNFKSNSVRSVSAMGALTTAGIAVMGVVGVMAYL